MNKEGYNDPTADKAIENVMREDKRNQRREVTIPYRNGQRDSTTVRHGGSAEKVILPSE